MVERSWRIKNIWQEFGRWKKRRAKNSGKLVIPTQTSEGAHFQCISIQPPLLTSIPRNNVSRNEITRGSRSMTVGGAEGSG